MNPFLQLEASDLIEHFADHAALDYATGQLISDREVLEEHVLIIRSGTARLSLTNERGGERLLFYACVGCVIGDTRFFNSRKELAESLRVIAVTPCRIIRVGHEAFRAAFLTNPKLLLSALTAAHNKLTAAIEQLASAAFDDTTHQLLDLLEAMAHRGDDGVTGNPIKLTHQELADATGRTRVSVTNALSRLETTGRVRLKRGSIELLDPARQ